MDWGVRFYGGSNRVILWPLTPGDSCARGSWLRGWINKVYPGKQTIWETIQAKQITRVVTAALLAWIMYLVSSSANPTLAVVPESIVGIFMDTSRNRAQIPIIYLIQGMERFVDIFL